MKPRIVLIGDTPRPEFHEACAALDDLACVTRLAGLESATEAIREGRIAPHGIVLAQSYPGQFPAAAVGRLRAAAPLARLIVLAGCWCEGEPRSGRPLAGTIRVYWHEAAVRLRKEIPRWFSPQSAWSLPVTATEEERLLSSLDTPLQSGDALIAIWARQRAIAELLANVCRAAGDATAWLHPRRPSQVRGAIAAIFDADALDAAALEELKRFTKHVSPAPVLALLGAPRIQDARAAESLGAAVLAKPFRVDELLWSLGTALTNIDRSVGRITGRNLTGEILHALP